MLRKALACMFAASLSLSQISAQTYVETGGNPVAVRKANAYMDNLLREASKSWVFYRYAPGSTSGPFVLRYPETREAVLRVNFRYTSGETDSAMVLFDQNGNPRCLYYQSDKTCNMDGGSNLERWVIIAGGAAMAMILMNSLSGTSGGSAGKTGHDDEYARNRFYDFIYTQRQINERLEQDRKAGSGM